MKQPIYPIYPSGTVRALLETDYVTRPTREALQPRIVPNAATGESLIRPRFFDSVTFATLRHVCARLIPQTHRATQVDLAGAIDERLAEMDGNGWRYDELPPDGEAYRQGLHGLDESARAMFGGKLFSALDEAEQDEVLLSAQRNEALGATWQTISARRFFEELLAEVTECYYSDPLTQEEIGYVGMADARGWSALKLDELEAHEPRRVEAIN